MSTLGTFHYVRPESRPIILKQKTSRQPLAYDTPNYDDKFHPSLFIIDRARIRAIFYIATKYVRRKSPLKYNYI